MDTFPVTRAGVVLAVRDVDVSVRFYMNQLGFDIDAVYREPPYASLSRAGMRLSLTEGGHEAVDRPGVSLKTAPNRGRTSSILVLEVPDCMAVFEDLRAQSVRFLAEPYSPPWGGHRCFCLDPDDYLIEIEQPA